MPHIAHVCLMIVLAAALGACSDDGGGAGEATTDAGSDAADTGVEADTATEADTAEPDTTPPLEPSTLFGPCVEDAQCPGEGAVCRTAGDFGAPGGYCTVPCEDRTPCDFNGVYHFCGTREGETQSYCERRCLNGFDCGRSTYTCQIPEGDDAGICYGICATDEDCGGEARCEPYSGRCTADAPSMEGAVNGEPCAATEDCRSEFCINEANNGWPGGMCISTCILGTGFNVNTFYAGETLPPGSCPGDEICLPLLGNFSRNDAGACLPACDADNDCRDGYTCRKSFDGSAGASTFTNGVCWPSG